MFVRLSRSGPNRRTDMKNTPKPEKLARHNPDTSTRPDPGRMCRTRGAGCDRAVEGGIW